MALRYQSNQQSIWWAKCLSQLKNSGMTTKDVSVFWRQGKNLGLKDEELCIYTIESIKKFISERFRSVQNTARLTKRNIKSSLPRSTGYHPYQSQKSILPAPSIHHHPLQQHQGTDFDLDFLISNFGKLSSDSNFNQEDEDLDELIQLLKDM